ncbi:hypothetical protein CAEBREN_32120 [Caenorhabditis brenneri]|uniref:Uncharacterized protein n=1 Tax=Caenorhabditis brenneri TaxID=135651 RepID=G0N9W4_CAEBE|nr:hypothetical protein CAEBREN_32120 [Caenorhabditis brenneri]
MLAERTNEDPAFPPYRPSKRIGAAPPLSEDASEDHQLAEENFRSLFLTPPPESMDDEQSEKDDDEVRQLFEEEDDELRQQSEEEDNGLYDQSEEVDENNTNELWDYIDEAEEIVYDSWVTYMYPVMSMQIDNNDPHWVDPEEY